MAGLGAVVVGVYFCFGHAQTPTIRFIAWRPLPEAPEIIAPTFEIRNDTRHPFTIVGSERHYRFLTAYGLREEHEKGMNCTGTPYFTLYPGQTFQGASPLAPGERFALGIRFYRGTKESLSAPRSFVAELLHRWFGKHLDPSVTWSDLSQPHP